MKSKKISKEGLGSLADCAGLRSLDRINDVLWDGLQ